MIRAEVDGVEYKVKFRHNTKGDWIEGRDIWARAVTKAKLEGPGMEVIGTANCSHADIFSKETGRKIALTRAVKPLPKKVRTAIWKAYFERH